MAARSEVWGDRPIGGEKPLCLAWGLEPLPAPFPLACWLGRVLGAVIAIAVLAVSTPGRVSRFAARSF
jgi:hypothetical protein